MDDPHRPLSSSGSLNLQEAVRVPSLFAGPLTSVRFSKVLPPCGMEPISMISIHFLVSCLGVHYVGSSPGSWMGRRRTCGGSNSLRCKKYDHMERRDTVRPAAPPGDEEERRGPESPGVGLPEKWQPPENGALCPCISNSLTIPMSCPCGLAPGVNSGQGLGIEIIGTLQLVLCVLATTDRRRRDLGGSGPLAIGLSVALGHLLAIDYTGCGINPARSFGSSVITHNFKDHWIFWVGPFIGGALAVLIYDFILAPRSSDLTDRVKVWTSGQVEEYELDGDDINSRVEMKPK